MYRTPAARFDTATSPLSAYVSPKERHRSGVSADVYGRRVLGALLGLALSVVTVMTSAASRKPTAEANATV